MASTYELIASQTLGSDTASVTFSSIPATYDDLVVVVCARSDRSGLETDAIEMQFNSSSTGYSWRQLYGSGSSAASYSYSSQTYVNGGRVSAAASTASTFGNTEIYIPNYAGSANKSVSITGVGENNATAAGIDVVAGLWASTSAISSIRLTAAGSANFVTGSSFQLFGVTHA